MPKSSRGGRGLCNKRPVCPFQEAMLHLQLPLLIIGIICAYQSPTGSFDQTICYQLNISYQHTLLFTDHRSTLPFMTLEHRALWSHILYILFPLLWYIRNNFVWQRKHAYVCMCLCAQPHSLWLLQYSIVSYLAAASLHKYKQAPGFVL